MRGYEDEWMGDLVYVVSLDAWMSPSEYLDYIEKITAEISTEDNDPPWP